MNNMYIKRLYPYRRSHRSAVSSFPPTVEAVEAASRESWVFGTSELGRLGRTLFRVECQEEYPQVAKKNTWYSIQSWKLMNLPLKRGPFQKERIVFWNLLFFRGHVDVLGVLLLGSSYGSRMPVSTKTNLSWIVDAVWSPLGITFTFHWYRRRGIYPNWKMMIHSDSGIVWIWLTKAWHTKMLIPSALSPSWVYIVGF